MLSINALLAKLDYRLPLLSWGMLLAWLAMIPISLHAASPWNTLAGGLQVLLMIALSGSLLSARFGIKATIGLFFITIVVINTTENLSIATGVPFGYFLHADGALGPKIFSVPIMVGPAYFAIIVPSWLWSDLVLERTPGSRVLARPLLSMFVASSLDACLDPIHATLMKTWSYPQGGGYFGVPITNSVGWMVTVFATLVLFELWLSRSKNGGTNRMPFHWFFLAPAMIGTSIVPNVVYLLTYPNRLAIDAVGQAWYSQDIYEATTLFGMHTLVLMAVLGFIFAQRRKQQ